MRVVIAEDLFLLRDGLVRLLKAHGIDVAAAVATGPELLDALLGQRPDAAIIDVRLPPTFTDEGLRVALAARREIPGLPVLVLSQYVEQLYARELLSDQVGGVGYLLKDRVFSDEPVRRGAPHGGGRRHRNRPGGHCQAGAPTLGGRASQHAVAQGTRGA